jgi:RHS repeat-associated protein
MLNGTDRRRAGSKLIWRWAGLLALAVLLPQAALAQTETVEYYALDAVGSVRVVFNADGTVKGRMDYTPFGGELQPAVGLPPEAFAGLFRDPEAGLDHAPARAYQVRTGRFNRPDPVYAGLFNPQRWNRYAYARNNPLRFVDPSGLSELPSWYCAEFPSRPECVYPEPDVELPGRDPQGPGNGCDPFSWFASCAPEEDPSAGSQSPPPQIPPPPPPTKCTSYVEIISEVIERSGLRFTLAGDAMVWVGLNNAMRPGVEGFKRNLTEPRQGDDVYKHLNFITGSMLAGRLPNVMGLSMIDLGEVLLKRGDDRLTAIVELRNDWAGFKVGLHAWRAVVTRDFERFERAVTREICEQ